MLSDIIIVVEGSMCNYIKADGRKCGNKGRCPHHDKLTKKNPVEKSPSFWRSATTSAVGNLLAQMVTVIFMLVLAVFFPNSFRILQTLNSPLPPSNPLRVVAAIPPQAPTNLEAHQSADSPVLQCCTTAVGPNTPAAPVLSAALVAGIPSSLLEESLSHSDSVTAVADRAMPAATEVLNGIDPNAKLGTQTWPGNQSLSDAMAALAKTNSQSGITTLTGVQPSSAQSFDWSKVISTPPMEPGKELMDASGVGSSQTGIAQIASLRMPANAGALAGISTPNGYQLSNPTINGDGTPIVDPRTWQALTTGSPFPATVPITLSPSVQ
jgi:hypothetical protein